MPRITSKQLRQEIRDLLDEAKAVDTLAASEDREFTDDETTRLDEINVEIGDDGQNGEEESGLWASVHKAERLENLIRQQAAQQSLDNTPAPQPSGNLQQPGEPSRIIIPATARYRHGSLKAYRGERADERAYTAGQFCAATLFRNERAAEWCRDHGIDIKFYGAMSGADNELGGFTAPTEMEAAIITLREDRGVFRREAGVTPMGTDTKTVPRRTSGVTAYFLGDGDAITASDKKFDNVALTAKKLGALTKYSSELSEDSIISIGDDLTSEIAYAFADKEDECGFNGDGTSTYGGIVGVLNAMNAGSIYTAAAGNTAFSTLDLADFEGVVGQLPQYAVANAKWYISRVGFYQSIVSLVDALGGNTTDHLAAGPNQAQFLGFPVVISQVLNSTTTAQASTAIAVLGDLRQGAVLGNRRGISVMISEHAYFANDQLAIRGIERFDIAVHETGTASAASSLIVLKTPAS